MENHPENTNDLRHVATGMENDPGADEQVIDQTGSQPGNVPDDVNPSGIEKPDAEEGTTPVDDLANALAYALDGSGTGMAGAPPAAPSVGNEQKVINEGTTGAGLEDEESTLPNR